MKAKILLVEDNQLTARGLQYLLEREDYQVSLASNLQAAHQLLSQADYDLLILDVGLPDGESFDLLRHDEANLNGAAVIFVTARDQEDDVVRGLELGAEDYITKPFRNRELLLRVNKALRGKGSSTKKLTVGHFSLDPEAHELLADGQMLPLTALEYRIIACLIENAGHIVTRERLLDEVYDASGKIVNDNTLSVYIKRLRQKLAPHDPIQTLKNIGYRFQTAELEQGSANE